MAGEVYGFSLNMSGDAAAKLTDLMSKFVQTSEKAKTTRTDVSKIGSALSGIAAKFTLGNIASSAITSAFSSISGMVSESAEKFLEAEKAATLLNFEVTRVGKEGSAALETLNDTAESSDLFTPTKIKNAERYLIQAGFTAKTVTGLIPLMQNFSVLSGKTMEESAASVIKGTRGMGREWIKYGVIVDKAHTASQNLATIEKYLGAQTGIVAEYAGTAAGKMDILNTSIEKQEEKLGAATIIWKKFLAELKSGFLTVSAYGMDPKTMFANQGENMAKDALTKNRIISAGIYDATIKELEKKYSGAELLKRESMVTEHWKQKSIAANTAYTSAKAGKDEDKIFEAANELDKIKQTYQKFASYTSASKGSPFKAGSGLYEDEADKLEKAQEKPEKVNTTALKKSGLNTSDLSGASGGLGQAKVITININDAVQKIVVDSKNAAATITGAADNAVQVLIRTINNLSLSQGGAM